MGLAIGTWVGLGALFWSLFRLRTRPPTGDVPPEIAAFVARFEREIELHHPQVEVRGMIPGRLAAVLAVRGQELPVSLHPLYRRVVAFPSAFSESLEMLIEEVEQDALEHTGDHAFADVATTILPQIRTEQWVRENAAALGPGSLVHRPLADDLVICYVIDTPWCMTFVCRAHLDQWSITEEGLYHLATRNLHQMAGSQLPVPTGDEPGVMVRRGDGFDASRVLLLDDEASEGLLVAIPDRDVLWFGNVEDEGIEQLMSMNDEMHERARHPLASKVYRISDGQLVPVRNQAATEA